MDRTQYEKMTRQIRYEFYDEVREKVRERYGGERGQMFISGMYVYVYVYRACVCVEFAYVNVRMSVWCCLSYYTCATQEFSSAIIVEMCRRMCYQTS
ncbi:hypothetical protein EON63_14330 [archaeon]|nr:MAG: hypothetical protein EON63_14330 [archaeon]